jgi:hypothetical protein
MVMAVNITKNSSPGCGSFCKILSCYAGYIWRALMIDRGGFIISKQKLDTVAMEESLVYINKL